MNEKNDRILWPMLIAALAFSVFPMLFAWLCFMKPNVERKELLRWDAVPCRIEKSNVERRGVDKFDFTATYSYEVNGKQYRSSVVGTSESDKCEFGTVRHRLPLLEKFAPGTEHECRVKPGAPNKAVLMVPAQDDKPEMPWTVCFVLAFFLMVGIGLAAQSLPAVRRKETDGFKVLAFCIAGVVFGLPFACLGIGSLLSAYCHHMAAKEYLPTPAKVLYSGIVNSRSSKGGVTYASVVGYQYMVDGRKYENDRLGHMRVYTSNYSAHAREIERYRPGAEITVWRSPDDPQDSVLDPNSVRWPLMAIMSFFACIGLTIIVGSVAHYLRSVRKREHEKETAVYFSRPLRRSHAETIALGVFATLWNALGWSGAAMLTDGFDVAHICPGWFVLIFPLFGIGLLCMLIRSIVREIRGPHFRLSLTCDCWRHGAQASVTYEQEGDEEIEGFKVNLVQTLKTDPAFGQQRHSRYQPVPSRSHTVCECGTAMKSGTFSFAIPEYFSLEDAEDWKIELVYRVAGREKELMDTYYLPR